MILGIDPGPNQSAYVIWNQESETIYSHGILENAELRHKLKNIDQECLSQPIIPAIEMVQSFGMAVGKEIFETVLFIGRVVEIFAGNVHLVYRLDIKSHFCHTAKAKDGNIRQALIDRFGKPGIKRAPGKLYKIHDDEWSALAVSVFYADTMPK